MIQCQIPKHEQDTNNQMITSKMMQDDGGCDCYIQGSSTTPILGNINKKVTNFTFLRRKPGSLQDKAEQITNYLNGYRLRIYYNLIRTINFQNKKQKTGAPYNTNRKG